MQSINDIEIKKTFTNLFSNLNQNNPINQKNDFFQRAFFVLNIPIEVFDLMNIPEDLKETIELIDCKLISLFNNFIKFSIQYILSSSSIFLRFFINWKVFSWNASLSWNVEYQTFNKLSTKFIVFKSSANDSLSDLKK